MSRWLILIAIMVIFSSTAYAGGAGTTGANFLKIGVGGRAVAMGETYCAISDDSFAAYWNPAGLTQLEGKEFSAMYTWWLEDISHQFLGYAQPFGQRGAFGLSLLGLQITGIEERETDTEDPKSFFEATNYAGVFSYGHRITEGLSLGGNLKFISERIKDKNASGCGLDIGGFYRPSAIDRLSLGLNIQNITLQKISFIEEGDELPLNIKVGTAYKTLGDSLTLALDLNLPSDNDLSYHVGTEYWIRRIIALRVGYNSQISGNKLGTFNLGEGLSAGLGVKVKALQFDAAYVPYGDLGDTYRVSLLIRFGGQEAE